MSDTQEEWLRKAKDTHGDDTYGYAKSVYRGQKFNVIITCRTHGDFEQGPTSHVCGNGCPKCGIEKTRNAKFLSDSDIIEMLGHAAALHPVKYAYVSNNIQNGRLIVQLMCPRHGAFEQRLDHHRNGHGCVRCCSSVSRSEIEWIAYLAVSFAGYSLQPQYKVPTTNYAADAFCEELNVVFEYHGDFWHGNPSVYIASDVNPRTGTTFGELYDRTMYKHTKYERLGYKVSAVWESDWKRAKVAVIQIQRAFRAKHSE
jgi:G:T-mismatch repair DNA endonuclease (very short patch repair protein)